MRQTHSATGAPAAIGPYSHAVSSGGVLYCSGQIGCDPASGELEGAAVATQARRCMLNLAAVCEAGGTSLQRSLRLTLYLVNLDAFAEVGDVCEEFFPRDPPARSTVQVSALPRGALVEIDAIVSLP